MSHSDHTQTLGRHRPAQPWGKPISAPIHPTDRGRSRRQLTQQAIKDQEGKPARPGEPCKTPPHPSWTEPERWAWDQICKGEIADFNKHCKKKLDPKRESQWSGGKGEERKISQRFMEMVLLHQPWQGAVGRQGFWLEGAWLPSGLKLYQAKIPFSLVIGNSRIEKEIELVTTRIDGTLSLEESCVTSKINMHNLQVEESLFMRKGRFAQVDIRGTSVGAQMSLTDATCTGKLNMDGLQVEESLFMGNGHFTQVDINGSSVGGQMDMEDATCTGKLRMHSLHIEEILFMRKGRFIEVEIIGSRVGGQMDMHDATCTGELDVQATSVGKDWFCRLATFHKSASITDTIVGDSLLLEEASFRDLNLSHSKIEGGLVLAYEGLGPTKWRSIWSKLTLHHTTVGRVADSEKAWPPIVAQEGFSYQYLGKSGVDSPPDLHGRSAQWFVDWLSRLPNFSPQPYEQCAKVLRNAGQTSKANKVLYESRRQEQKQAFRDCFFRRGEQTEGSSLAEFLNHLAAAGEPVRAKFLNQLAAAEEPELAELLSLLEAAVDPPSGSKFWERVRSFGRWAWLALVRTLVGHGLGWRYFHAVFWVVFFVILGVVVASREPVVFAEHNNLGWWVAYSLDKFIPLVDLDDCHSLSLFTGWQRGYFFFVQQGAGGLISLMLLAGLTGLTRRR